MKNAILAGLAIGFACILFLLAPSPLIGALLFALGLLNIRAMKYTLFTGQVQNLLTQEQTAKSLTKIFFANFLGICIAVLFGLLIPEIPALAYGVACAKLALPIGQLFAQSAICGYLMTVATRPSTPWWMTALCVFAFVITGLNHSIADMFYYLFSKQLIAIPALGVTAIGNVVGGLFGALKKGNQSQNSEGYIDAQHPSIPDNKGSHHC